MAFDDGSEGGEASGGSSRDFGGGSESFDSGSESSGPSLERSDSPLEMTDDFGGESDAECSAFSSTDSQLDSAYDFDKSENTAAFESTDSQLEDAFENVEFPVEERVELPVEENVELPAEKQNVIRPFANSAENNEYLRQYNEQLYINDSLSEVRGNPNKALESIDKQSLYDRIERDTTVSSESDMRSQYLDMTRAKGFLQEEMIKSTLNSDFEVSSITVKSVHEDGSYTYTDIQAQAKHDVEIGEGVVIHEGDMLAIESKVGSESYLSSQINHIDRQLEGMPEDSHRMLFVTADVNRLSAQDKERLGKVLEKNNAVMNVLPYYSDDLMNTIMHIDTGLVLHAEAGEAAQSSDESDESDIGQAENRFSLADTVRSAFGRQENSAEKTEEAAENQILQMPEESQSEDFRPEDKESVIARERQRLEADTYTVNELLKEDRPLSKLSEGERAAVINVAVAKAMEHDPGLTLDMAENYRGRIHFANLDEVAAENGVDADYAKRIQGYYSPSSGMRINTDAYGSETSETLVTITHEALHMIAQRYDGQDKPIAGMTGLKRSDLPQSRRNVGMNEGVTEMYASRDMSELLPNRQEGSYVREVEVMQQYERVVGGEMLHDAYMFGGTAPLKEDFDRYTDNGRFDEFCRMMDRMHFAEQNRDFGSADVMRREAEKILGEYARNKEEYRK